MYCKSTGVMKKQAETLDSKEGRQNIFRIAKQKKKERKDITGTNCLKEIMESS